MRAFNLVMAAVICCILGPASIGPSKAQTADWFGLQVCNASGIRNVSISILSKNDINGQNWHLVGWYIIPDGGCFDAGGYWRDKVYIYGQGDGGATWDGNDTPQCVNLTARFERIIAQSYDFCNAGETSVGMFLVQVPQSTGNYTMTLR